jgi:hypothetical protein
VGSTQKRINDWAMLFHQNPNFGSECAGMDEAKTQFLESIKAQSTPQDLEKNPPVENSLRTLDEIVHKNQMNSVWEKSVNEAKEAREWNEFIQGIELKADLREPIRDGIKIGTQFSMVITGCYLAWYIAKYY